MGTTTWDVVHSANWRTDASDPDSGDDPGALSIQAYADDPSHSTDLTDRAAWTTVTPGGYSRQSYYMRATDRQGHSQNMQVKVTEQIAGMIGALVASGMTRYKTPQDFVRDAIVHRLHDMHEMGRAGLIAGQLPELIASAQIEQNRIERDARAELLKRTDEEVRVLVGRGQTEEAVGVLDGLEMIATNWPEHDQRLAADLVARGNDAIGMNRRVQADQHGRKQGR